MPVHQESRDGDWGGSVLQVRAHKALEGEGGKGGTDPGAES